MMVWLHNCGDEVLTATTIQTRGNSNNDVKDLQKLEKETKEFKGFNSILLHTDDLRLTVVFAIKGDLVKFR
ncbi:unnamed protein product, partial [Citrullus colocynthis]